MWLLRHFGPSGESSRRDARCKDVVPDEATAWASRDPDAITRGDPASSSRQRTCVVPTKKGNRAMTPEGPHSKARRLLSQEVGGVLHDAVGPYAQLAGRPRDALLPRQSGQPARPSGQRAEGDLEQQEATRRCAAGC